MAPRLIVGRKPAAEGIGEDQIVVYPCRAERQTLFILALPVRSERLGGTFAEFDLAAAILGLGSAERPSPLFLHLERRLDVERAALDVHIAPAQPEEFSFAHAGSSARRKSASSRSPTRCVLAVVASTVRDRRRLWRPYCHSRRSALSCQRARSTHAHLR